MTSCGSPVPNLSCLVEADDLLCTGLIFSSPPTIVVHQGLFTQTHVDKAWAVARGELPLSAAQQQGMHVSIADSVFVPFALNQELKQARTEGEREQEANLGMMVLATVTFELAHWV